jgi:hypothetical protein
LLQVLEKTCVPIIIYDKATDEILVPKVEILEPDHASLAKSAAWVRAQLGWAWTSEDGAQKKKANSLASGWKGRWVAVDEGLDSNEAHSEMSDGRIECGNRCA